MSDHADWDGLISAIDATGCEKVYLTHGYTASFTRYLNEIGFDAHEVHTLYGGEEEEATVTEVEEKADTAPSGDVVEVKEVTT
jgi:putative mRNA 3-end processing factor